MKLYRKEFNHGMSKSPEPSAYLAIKIQGLIETMDECIYGLGVAPFQTSALDALENVRDALKVINESLTKGFIKCVNDNDTKEALEGS